MESDRLRLPLEEDLVIPVGGRRSVRVSTGTVEPDRRHLGFTVVRLSGVFRPAVLRAGDEEFYSGVPMKEAIVRVFPPGYEPIAEDPMGTLVKACRLGAREHLLIAAELIPRERRREATGLLIGMLGDEATPTAVAGMTALRRLTGLSFQFEPMRWKGWWKEEQGGLD
jgi:hypothetical protein